jgi:hypothetical protein
MASRKKPETPEGRGDSNEEYIESQETARGTARTP